MKRSGTCDWCGKVFQCKWANEHYCSEECKQHLKDHAAAARTRRGKGGNHRPRHVKRCPIHGCLIETKECLTCRVESVRK